MKERVALVFSALFIFSALTPLLVIVDQSGEVEAAAASPVKWIRYAGNPILGYGSSGSWDVGWGFDVGCVIQDIGGYKMYYDGNDSLHMRIGLATSADGKSWTKYAANPILSYGSSGTWDCAHLNGPAVIKDGSTYKMWYSGSDWTHYRIGYATSSDGISWTKYAGNPIFNIGGNGEWDRGSVGYCNVIKEGNEYKMWFSGNTGSSFNIGYANSSDGINWTKCASNPVLKTGVANSWDALDAGLATVVNVSGEYRMWYSGEKVADQWSIGYASSTNGIDWTKFTNNPVLVKGAGWDATNVFFPSVLYNGSAYQMWYTGVASGGAQKIGYAEGWNTIPNAPSISAPANNIWTTNNKPTFSWTFSDPNTQDSQTAYQVQLDDDSGFGSVNYDTGKVPSAATSYTPVSAFADGIYYWRAMVWDSDDDGSPLSASRIIKIDTVPPVNPGVFSSASHVTGVWSNDNTIDISFSGASDAASGLDGYSFIWDYASNTLPDATKDIEETTSTRTSPSMSDSNSIYFHIRAMDNAGNIAADATHYGPFYIDSTPPLNPSVTSVTHAVGIWTKLTVCTVAWSGANGSISGINGFSALWDNSAGTLPGAVKNIDAGANNTTSPALADGTWYFHIRTRDEAGNWAAGAAHYGPIQIDATPPFNPQTITSDRPPGTWSNDNTIDVVWSGANGAVSGLDGFSYVWDEAAGTMPDETKESEEGAMNATSPSLQDGQSWYFHIRTRDNAGNWNASAVHLGPFWIDSSPPSNPIALSSGSHAIGKWSNDITIDVTWSVADAGGRISGYDGFSIVWDISNSTVPDTSVDYGSNVSSATSPPMSDGDAIYFHIRAKDRAGNWAADASHLGPFWIDSTAPRNPSVVRSAGHTPGKWSADNTVDINWSGADGSISGIDGYSFLWDTEPFTVPPETVNVSDAVLGTTSPVLADGTSWYFHIRVRDRAGNWAGGAVHSGPYYIDATPPAIHNLSINGGAEFTANSTVLLRMAAADAEPGSGLGQMRWKADGGDWSEWQEYGEDWNVTMSGADGPRTVSLQVRDIVGNPSPVVNATIFLDTRGPTDVDVKINGGANSTKSTSVTLNISASEPAPGSGLAEMSLSRDGKDWGGWEPFQAMRVYNLTIGDGVKTVYVRVRDRAGNIGGPVSDSILLDTVAPVSLAITIAGGNAYTTNLSVSVQVRATDPEPASGVGDMSFSEDGMSWTQWEPYNGVKDYSFTPGEGMRALHLRVRDRALNEAGPANDTILVDTTPPLIRSVQVSGITQSIAVVTWYTDEPSNGVAEYGTGAGYGSSLADPAFTTEHSLTLTGLAAATEYHVRVSGKDVYGNGPTYGKDVTFRTNKAEDRKAPAVSNVKVEGVSDRTALISWETDEPADSLVEYGTTREPDRRAANATFVSRHTILLTGLAPGTAYYFRARSVDPSGNGPGSSELLGFTTGISADRTPPGISDVKVSGMTDSLAVISWTTDEPADSRLELGPGPAYNRLLSSDRFEIGHSIVVTGLQAGKEYHFRVGSTDTSGNGPSYSDDASFTTSLVKDTAAPAIQSMRVVTAGQDNVTLEVVLSEPGMIVVDFGEGRAYGKTVSATQFRTAQQLTITGLEPGRTYHYRVLATDASGNGPTVGGDQTFKTKAAAVKSGDFALTTESMPFLLIAIIVLAVGLTAGLYAAGKRTAQRKQAMSRALQYPPPVDAQSGPVQPPATPMMGPTVTVETPQEAFAPALERAKAPPGMTVVEKVDAAELEDEEEER